MREAFERAILDNPDDSTAYAAYADWLMEQDDPRGEFMQVQLALEDESRPTAERKKLQEREAELLKEHERDWLGELAPYLLDNSYGRSEFRWKWGFLATVPYLSVPFAQALATSPAARFLRELYTNGMGYREESDPPPRAPLPPGVDEHAAVFELVGSACLQNLRVFSIGEDPGEDGWTDCHTYCWGLEHVIGSMPRIEEVHLFCRGYEIGPIFALPNLTHLRVFKAFHLGGRGWDDRRYEYPLDVLAANPAFANLTHLQFHPHCREGANPETGSESYIPIDQVRALVRSPHLKSLTHLQLRLSDMGDEGVREVVASGILKRLKWLDLRHGAITDEGAKLFAACPDARNLERLDLSRNAVTAAGLNLLRAAKINAVANSPLTQQELEGREYLREGDFE